MKGLREGVYVVTGAGSGIGRATAERLAGEGAKTWLVGLDGAKLEAVADEIRADGGEATATALDVTDEKALTAAIDAAAETHGRLDGLVNNAGVLTPGTTLELDPAEWDRTIEVNLRAIFLAARAALPHMLERGSGAIVNTASIGGLYGVPRGAAYNASKGAVVNYTRQLALDFGPKGVRVNCVCPGWVPTGFNDPMLEGFDDEALDTMVRQTVPLGRQADPAEIAATIAFLLSDESSYVNGHALVVDGGLTASA
jgi:NAD(P)-dependent dehydrogenase (short-subunit alcohol dehydrogenase family)